MNDAELQAAEVKALRQRLRKQEARLRDLEAENRRGPDLDRIQWERRHGLRNN